MDRKTRGDLYAFYEKELKENILRFWLPRCIDREYGGYLNCFTNRGDRLVSYDKYTWSQGRFLWLFSRLAVTEAPLFSEQERQRFLEYARQGAAFLEEHCLMGEDDWRAVFLMGRGGEPKAISPGAPLDMSIYADCFVIVGMAMYAYADSDPEAYQFAKRLYRSVRSRVALGRFRTLPYPLSKTYRAHGIPMMLSHTAHELHRAAAKMEPAYCGELRSHLQSLAEDILTHFVDQDNVLHEVLTCDNQFFPQVLCQHMNPGHTIEDAWFLLDAARLCERPDWNETIYAVALRALANGWDDEFGGLLHFCGVAGGPPVGDTRGVEHEAMTQQLTGWSDKLWWIHSEALYTTLRCYIASGNEEFLQWYHRISRYTFQTFPNPDSSIGEWIQIRGRDGAPQDKVVALPVKDPYHIARNMLLILELLHQSIWGGKEAACRRHISEKER